jgi:hypothetical protein
VEQADVAPALERASLSELLQAQTWYDDGAKLMKERLGEVKAELARRFGESARQALAQQGKEHGSGKLELQDRFAVKFDVKRTVKWDSDKLFAVAQTLPWERVQKLFKIDFSMSETVYKGIEALAPDLCKQIDDARTTETKAPVITLIKEDACA